jgi:hypothetical protein
LQPTENASKRLQTLATASKLFPLFFLVLPLPAQFHIQKLGIVKLILISYLCGQKTYAMSQMWQ